jgi:hypothetical protein
MIRQLMRVDTELENLRIQLNKVHYDLSNVRTESERTKLRYEAMIRDRDTQIIVEQKKSEDLQKDRKFLFEKQQSQATELLTLQDEYANYKVVSQPMKLIVVGGRSYFTHIAKREWNDERSSGWDGGTTFGSWSFFTATSRNGINKSSIGSRRIKEM